jgi:hypothetical protein
MFAGGTQRLRVGERGSFLFVAAQVSRHGAGQQQAPEYRPKRFGRDVGALSRCDGGRGRVRLPGGHAALLHRKLGQVSCRVHVLQTLHATKVVGGDENPSRSSGIPSIDPLEHGYAITRSVSMAPSGSSEEVALECGGPGIRAQADPADLGQIAEASEATSPNSSRGAGSGVTMPSPTASTPASLRCMPVSSASSSRGKGQVASTGSAKTSFLRCLCGRPEERGQLCAVLRAPEGERTRQRALV